MKKFLALIITMAAVFNTASYTFADVKKIQLTDFRYQNGSCLSDGYSVWEYYTYPDVFLGTRLEEEEASKPAYSVILKPDGTELFEQGKYSVNYEMMAASTVFNIPEDLIHMNFPQYNDWFFVHPLGDNSYKNLWRSDDIYTDISGNYKRNELGNVSSNYNSTYLYDYDENTIICIDRNGRELFSIPTGSKYHFCGIVHDDVAVFGKQDYTINGFDENNLILTNVEKLVRLSDKKVLYDNINHSHNYLYVRNDGLGFKIGYCDQFYKTNSSFGYDYFSWDGAKYEKTYTDYDRDAECEPYFYKPYCVTFNDDGSTELNIDKSYLFESKEIGGQKYCALFKLLSDGESEDAYTPSEKPSDWAAESVQRLTDEGLLYNNAKCRYSDEITRQDFCILAVEAYCKLQGLEIDEYITKNNISLDFDKFKDTDNVYILLANSLGIVTGMSEDTFAPAEKITRQQAAVMLSNMAGLLNLSPNSQRVDFSDKEYFADWADDSIYNITSIKNEKGIAVMAGTKPEKFSPWMAYSREQAYVTICRLYDMCK